ncbi:MAG TPA: N-6 DNA methylase, partial [Caldisericia bacterium]|nr:N-6 DNA methylase [Caldisericia bacterium]
PAFSSLLKKCAQQFNYTLVEQYSEKNGGHSNRYDGLLVDEFKLHHGIWEAKDTGDKLDVEIKKKFERGYPNKNIMFQEPKRIVIYQNGRQVFDEDVTKPEKLVEALKIFFEFEQPIIEDFHKAVEQFKAEIPRLAQGLQQIIDEEQAKNQKYKVAFASFAELCKKSINPNISEAALEEMLIQHLLTERLFRTVFNNPDFIKRNVIAAEIEKVIEALASRSFNRSEFTSKLDRFYRAIEEAARDIRDWGEMQGFMNTVYEKFFQGFAVKVADTHGIVYTPQPIVNFMVRSVEDILQREFGRSLSDEGVHILDPFVGTGNFIMNVMRSIKKSALMRKYENELHCNEVMLLPYYVACMNIEHEYWENTKTYQPFEGICFVDTFQLAEPEGSYLFSMTEKNTERVEKQKKTPIFVIISNPPYNAGQVNQNDNNKNRKYPVIDKRVAETYAKDSKATLMNQLYDPYVKAIRWASDRICKNGEGIVAVVTNNSFIDQIAFDGMRKHLKDEFDLV